MARALPKPLRLPLTTANGETVTQDVVITVNGANDFDAQDDFAVVAEGGSITVNNDAGQSVGNPITDASSTFNATFDGDENVAVEALAFNNDGSKLYLLENNTGRIQQHTLSTQFDVSTASTEYTVYDGVNWSRDLVFNADGTKAFTINPSTDIIYEYELTTPFDISTMDLVVEKAVSDGQGTNIRPKGLAFSSDGTKLFYIDQEGKQIIQENLGTAYDTSTASLAAILDISEVQGNGAWGEGFVISPDGRKMFATSEGNHIYEWALHTPNDITTATFIHDRDLSSFGYTLRGLAFSNDGSKLFFANKSSGTSQDVVTLNTSVPFSTFYDEPSHSGDVIDTNRDRSRDTGGSLAVASIRTGATEGSGDAGTLGTPLAGTYGSLTMYADGRYTYQANSDISNWDAGKVGYDQFNYTINQGGDPANGADHAVLTIKVVAQDDAPTVATAAVDPDFNEDVDASAQDLVASGTIIFSDDLDNHLTITGAASTTVTPSNGVTLSNDLRQALEGAFSPSSITANGNTATWTLNVQDLDLDFLAVGESITLEYEVTAEDDGGQTVSDTITVNINGTNDMPSPADSEVTVDEDTEYSFSVSDFGFSDSEDGGNFTSFDVVTLPSNGTLTAYRQNQYGEYYASSSLVGNFFENITRAGMENDEIRLRFTPDANESGAAYASFHIRVYDSNGAASPYNHQLSDLGLVTINVTPVNDAPTAADDTINATSGTDEEGNVLDNDSDPDGTTPTVSAIETGSTPGSGTAGTVGSPLTGTYGVLTLQESGGYTYVVDADNANVLALGAGDDPLTETFTYTITDGSQTDTATITVNVSGVNDAPTVDTPAVDPDFNEDVDASAQDLVASGTIIFEDVDETELSITGATSATVTASNGVTLYADLRQALEAAFSITTDGNTATWTLNVQDLDLDFLDVGDSITLEYDVTAEDDVGETVTDTITVTINGTNDVPRFADRKTQTTNGVGSNVVVELPATISEFPDGHEYENSSLQLHGWFLGGCLG